MAAMEVKMRMLFCFMPLWSGLFFMIWFGSGFNPGFGPGDAPEHETLRNNLLFNLCASPDPATVDNSGDQAIGRLKCRLRPVLFNG
jgi:hypothetical protein